MKKKQIHRSDKQSIIVRGKLQKAIDLCNKLNTHSRVKGDTRSYYDVVFRNGRYIPAV